MAEAAGIFVSHAHEDNVWCRSFVEALRQGGATVWYDEHNLGYGVLGEEIERELQTRPIFIVIFSPASVVKPWVRREMNAAIHLRDQHPERIILPVVAEQAEIPLFWQEYKRVSGPGDTGISATEAAGRMIHALGIVPASATTAPTPLVGTETAAEVYERGKGLYAQNRYTEALSAFERALTLDPQDAKVWYYTGVVLADLKRYEEALSAYEQALALDPKRYVIWTYKGKVLADLKRNEEAIAAYQQALSLNPKYAYAWGSKANALYAQKRYEEALAAYEQALTLGPEHSSAWNNQGLAYLGLHRYDDALMSIEQALAMEPNNANFWDSQGEILLKAGWSKEAFLAYEQALTLDPHFASAWDGKIAVLFDLGRWSEAQEARRQRDEALSSQ